jgi:hypothetical protein
MAAAALTEGRTSRKEKDRVEEERRMGKREKKKEAARWNGPEQ